MQSTFSLRLNLYPEWTLIISKKLKSPILLMKSMQSVFSRSILILSKVQFSTTHLIPMKTCWFVLPQVQVRQTSPLWPSFKQLNVQAPMKMWKSYTFLQWKHWPTNWCTNSPLSSHTWKLVNLQVIFSYLRDNLQQPIF